MSTPQPFLSRFLRRARRCGVPAELVARFLADADACGGMVIPYNGNSRVAMRGDVAGYSTMTRLPGAVRFDRVTLRRVPAPIGAPTTFELYATTLEGARS